VSGRIRILDRLVFAVGIQVQAQGIIAITGKGVFLHKPCGDRVVHPGVQVIEAGLKIVLVAGVEDIVVDGSGLVQDVAECVVVIGGGYHAGDRKKVCHIGMSVIHVEENIPSDLPGQKVDPVYIAPCLVSQVILFEHDFVVFVEVSGQGSVDGFADAQAVSVIGVD
jgi:hypothetical protein